MRDEILNGFKGNINEFEDNPQKAAKSALNIANSFAYHGDREKLRADLERILALSGLDVDLNKILGPKDNLYFSEAKTKEVFKKLQELGLAGAFFLNGKTLYLYQNENEKPSEQAINELLKNYSEDYVKDKVSEVEKDYQRKLKRVKRKLSEAKREFSSGYRLDDVVKLFNHNFSASRDATDSGGIHINYNAPVNYGTINNYSEQPQSKSRIEDYLADRIKELPIDYAKSNHYPRGGCVIDESSNIGKNSKAVNQQHDKFTEKTNGDVTRTSEASGFSLWPLLVIVGALLLL